MTLKDIQELFKEAEKAFQEAEDEKNLYDLKVRYMGKKGSLSLALSLAFKRMKEVPMAERPAWGKVLHQIRHQLNLLYQQKKEELSKKSLRESIEKQALDLSLPGPLSPTGAPHPLFQTMERLIDIFTPLGYSIRTGPCVESDWYNFTALNFPPNHPSRALQDSFYIDEDHVLRTHTSPVQIRVLESSSPPLAVLAPGAVFRRDSDISHSPMFHQLEGLYVNKKVSMADLKGLLSYFLRKLFSSSKVSLRFRPSFFPFTEPSAEYDISCPFCRMKGCSVCKKSGWLEIGGCGLVHPKVFQSVNLDPSKWQGFAFGLGIERLALILYGIPDIRLFFENDLRFLKQFSPIL